MDHEAGESTRGTAGRRALPCTGTLVTVLLAGEHTAGRFALVEAVDHRDAAHPLHVHSREDEVVYLLEGRVRFYLGGEWIEREAGETLLLPRGHEHTHAVVSDAATLLMLLVPAGLEGYYRELGRPVGRHHAYQDAERLVVVAARYGIDITGPVPPNPAGLP